METTLKKKRKSASDEISQEQDETKIFWQLRKVEALEEKRKPTIEHVISVCLDDEFPECCVEIGANIREPLKT